MTKGDLIQLAAPDAKSNAAKEEICMSVKKFVPGVHSRVGAIENRDTKPTAPLIKTPSNDHLTVVKGRE